MSAGSVLAAVAAMRAAHDDLAGLSFDALNQAELVEVMDELETLGCQLPTQTHRALARLQTETTAKEMGAKSWRTVLSTRWRISTSEAGRRLDEAAVLGPRLALTGQPLPPLLATTAAAQARGTITGEHVTVIRSAMGRLPGWVRISRLTADELQFCGFREARRLGRAVKPHLECDASSSADTFS